MSPDKFEVAEKLAEAACLLDTAKLRWPDVDCAALLELTERMYDAAEMLAGDRKGELYGEAGDDRAAELAQFEEAT